MSEEEIIKYIKTLNEITKKNNKKGIVVGLEISTEMADKLLNLIEKQDKMINKAIKEIETLRQYFDESSQGDFIRILEILKDKNVIDW